MVLLVDTALSPLKWLDRGAGNQDESTIIFSSTAVLERWYVEYSGSGRRIKRAWQPWNCACISQLSHLMQGDGEQRLQDECHWHSRDFWILHWWRWPVVRNHQIRKTMCGKHGPPLGNGFGWPCLGNHFHLQSLGVGVYHYKEHLPFEGFCIINMEVGPQLGRPFPRMTLGWCRCFLLYLTLLRALHLILNVSVHTRPPYNSSRNPFHSQVSRVSLVQLL